MSALQNDTLYVILFLQNSALVPGQYHWGLYHHHNEAVGGKKYHIRNISSGGWMIDHAQTLGALKSFLLVGLMKIADTNLSIYNAINALITANDQFINQGNMTCRIYVLSAIQRLMERGIVRCNSLQALETEVKAFGDRFAIDANNNRQPRPIVSSRQCGY